MPMMNFMQVFVRFTYASSLSCAILYAACSGAVLLTPSTINLRGRSAVSGTIWFLGLYSPLHFLSVNIPWRRIESRPRIIKGLCLILKKAPSRNTLNPRLELAFYFNRKSAISHAFHFEGHGFWCRLATHLCHDFRIDCIPVFFGFKDNE